MVWWAASKGTKRNRFLHGEPPKTGSGGRSDRGPGPDRWDRRAHVPAIRRSSLPARRVALHVDQRGAHGVLWTDPARGLGAPPPSARHDAGDQVDGRGEDGGAEDVGQQAVA